MNYDAYGYPRSNEFRNCTFVLPDEGPVKHHVRYFWKKYIADWYQIHAELKPGELTEVGTFKTEKDARDYVEWKNR